MLRVRPAVVVALVLASLGALPGAARAQNPAPPTATTEAVTDVGVSTARVNGRVDPAGAATTYRFEYGTSTSYGLTTPERSLAEGAPAAAATEALSGLTANTTYHVRLVATNAAGVARGSDRSFRTLTAATRPSVATATASEITLDGATLAVRINPQALDTTWQFDYGTTKGYGASTPPVVLPASRTTSTVRARVSGLNANTLHHFRIRAVNASGTRLGGDRTFRTAKVPVGLALVSTPSAVSYGQTLSLTGQATGSDRSGLTVLLERRPFPFSADFVPVTTGKTSSAGAVTFSVPPFTSATEFRLSAGGAVSTTRTVGVRAAVRTRVVRRGGRVRVTGAIAPGGASGRVSLQRRTDAGRYVPVQRVAIRTARDLGRFTFSVRARRVATTYRVATLLTGGALLDGRSDAFRVAARR